MKKQKNAPARMCGALGTLVMVLTIAMFLVILVPQVLGYRIYNVISGSMEPTIPVGSAILVGYCEPEELEVGTVITYAGGGLGGDAVVTHRVIENKISDKSLVTKGDANAENDPGDIPYTQVIGKVVLHVAGIGGALAFLSTVSGKLVALGGIGIGLLFFALESMLSKKDN